MRLIDGVSHLVIATGDLAAAAADYERLLGTRAAALRDANGRPGHWFDAANLSVLLRGIVDDEAPGLAALVFRVSDLARAREEAGRCGAPTAPAVGTSWSGDQLHLRWREAAFERGATHGLPLALADRPATAGATGVGLDHVVIRTPAPERAVALYGGRLGLDMRLDRANPVWNARLLFFRCGDLVVEIAHPLSDGVSDGPDVFGGLSWRVPDLAAAHAGLAAARVNVSEPRTGRRPGSRVFSVRDRTGGVPTIILGLEPRAGG